MREKSVTATQLRLILAGPGGCCTRPPDYKTILAWVDLGMPYAQLPGSQRKTYRPSACIRWILKNGKHQMGETV
jgi:hypothetical protein